MSLRQLLNQDYELWRSEDGKDDEGFPIKKWVKIADIKGTVRPADRISESFSAGGEWGIMHHAFYCLPGTPIKKNDQIRKDEQTILGEVVVTYQPSRPVYIVCRLRETQ